MKIKIKPRSRTHITLHLLKYLGPKSTFADLKYMGPRSYATDSLARKQVNKLINHGYVVEEEEGCYTVTDEGKEVLYAISLQRHE